MLGLVWSWREAASVSDVEYARGGDGTHVAYRVLGSDAEGDAASDVVMASGGLIPMQVFEDDPGCVRLLEGLCSFGRVVVFDRRGLGQSDPIVEWERPILDQWADDLCAVVEASGVTDPVVFAWDGRGVATRFAATHPARLRALVLYQPVTMPDDGWDGWVTNQLGVLRDNLGGGGQDDFLERIAPSRASDASFRDWYARAGRLGASPAARLGSGNRCSAPDRPISSSRRSRHRRWCCTAATTRTRLAKRRSSSRRRSAVRPWSH